jgi:uncharacterized protein
MERELIIILGVIILIGLTHIFLSSVSTETKLIPITGSPAQNLTHETITRQVAEIKVPAVDNEGRGVVTNLIVEAVPGNGKVLVNIENLLFWIDTQYSIRVAKKVAEEFTKMNLSNIDLSYTIETNASVIEGQSAGAAIAIATIATLQNKTINKSVMITGTINPDGSIGQVGAIVAKAKAAKDINATLFLVPRGQGVQINYKPVQKCEKIGPITYCTIEYKEERVDVTKEAGIEVKEVSRIEEALKYFL